MVEFVEAANIAGSLVGTGTRYTFSDLGGTIGGNVDLLGGSTTTGGTIDNRITVTGDVNVDEDSVFGGNWAIAGDLVSFGRIAPGNSIGRISIDGDLTLSRPPFSTWRSAAMIGTSSRSLAMPILPGRCG